MVYQWKTPIFSQVSPQTAGEHIEELDRLHGEVTPKILLDDSRPEDAPLHPCYEWDDGKAAEKYRLHQSKMIIGNLVIVRTEQEDLPPEPVRAFVSVNTGNDKASYRPTMIALSNSETKEKVIENALRELRMFEKKYRGLLNTKELIERYFNDAEQNQDS